MALFQREVSPTDSRLWQTAAICVLLKLLQTLSTAISMVPQLRLLESNICRTYYQINDASRLGLNDDVPQRYCKIDPVQTELALLTGWNSFFSHTSVLVLAIPYGMLIERFSRRSVLVWNISFSVLSRTWIMITCYFYNNLNIRLIWLANLIESIGGGKLVFSTVTQVIIAEMIPIEHLSNFYFRLTSIMSICRFLGVAGGSFLLGYSIWTPIWLAAIIYSMCLLVVPSLHQRSPTGSYQLRSVHHQQKPRSEDTIADERRNDDRPHTRHTAAMQHTPSHLAFIKSHFLILAAFMVHETGMGVRNIAEQWISKRYGWPLRITGYILAFETLLGSIFLAILPMIARYLPSNGARNPESAQKHRQFIITRGSLLAAATGTALIAASGQSRFVLLVALCVFVLGVGFHDALKAYVTGLIHKEAIARMYICISVAETIANVFSGPAWAGIYGLSLSAEGSAMSLPFIVSSLLFLGSLSIVHHMKREV